MDVKFRKLIQVVENLRDAVEYGLNNMDGEKYENCCNIGGLEEDGDFPGVSQHLEDVIS